MAVSPPSPRLPPLNALRAFEAAARLGGFAAAAVELGVTPGAVAAHVKALEEDLGARLFERHSRGVRLTALGQRALPEFTAGFDALAGAVLRLRREAAPSQVHVAALPALAQLWLSQRLPRLRAAHPGLDLSVTALEQPPNLKRAPFDLALFYCEALPPGALDLGADEIFPVCGSMRRASRTSPGVSGWRRSGARPWCPSASSSPQPRPSTVRRRQCIDALPRVGGRVGIGAGISP